MLIDRFAYESAENLPPGGWHVLKFDFWQGCPTIIVNRRVQNQAGGGIPIDERDLLCTSLTDTYTSRIHDKLSRMTMVRSSRNFFRRRLITLPVNVINLDVNAISRLSSPFLFFFPSRSCVNVTGRERAPVWLRMFWEIRFARENSLTGAPSDFGSKFGNALFPLKKVFERGLRGSIYRLDSSPLSILPSFSLLPSPPLSPLPLSLSLCFWNDVFARYRREEIHSIRDEYSLITNFQFLFEWDFRARELLCQLSRSNVQGLK